MLKDRINAFAKALSEYIAKGYDCEYEIYACYGDSFDVKVIGGEIDNYSVNDFIGISLRVKHNGKTGYSSTTVPDIDDIPRMVSRAINNAEIIESGDMQFIYGGDKEYPHPKTFSEELYNVTASEKIDLARRLEKTALESDDMIVRTMGSYVCSSTSGKIIKNSSGLDVSEQYGYIAAYVIPIAQKGEEMNSGFAYTAALDASGLDIEKAGRQASEDAIRYCGISSCKAGRMKTVIDNMALIDLFSAFDDIFSSENAQRGLSLLAGKEGEKIASDCVNITDDPLQDGSFGARGFDDEGVATRTCRVVENGVLKTLLYNLKTAHKAGKSSTASACKGSYSSPVSIGFSNFCLESGEYTRQQLLQMADNGIIITSLEGLHAGANSATGDFSLSAKGILIKDGREDRAVTGLTVSGNIYELLKNIQCVGNDVRVNPFGMVASCPSVLLDKPMAIASEGE